MPNRTVQIILAEKFKSILAPYSGGYLSNKEVKTIARKCAKAVTGEDEDPVKLAIDVKNNTILERGRDE